MSLSMEGIAAMLQAAVRMAINMMVKPTKNLLQLRKAFPL